jgi:hypothetical protein
VTQQNGKPKAERSPSNAEDKTFRTELLDDLAAASANRQAHCNLPLTGRISRQRQVDQIDAADQENCCDRSH